MMVTWCQCTLFVGLVSNEHDKAHQGAYLATTWSVNLDVSLMLMGNAHRSTRRLRSDRETKNASL